ncbi:MAG: 3-isopropylmalate dehydratase small subunit [Thermoplasmata archaeon]|jgi:3-isopropylmalate dehydratase small subunit|nr:3-isopropylmalate dehydratase small subunit [Thermoplasmata archaeon]
MAFRGRVWKFGDDVNTDLIIPGRYLDNYDPAHLAAHVMEGASRQFAGRVRRGDFVVAGRNFGCGSSREQAVIALKHAGVSAVVAKSFARIFYRNAVNLALPVVVSPEAFAVFEEGEAAELDMSANRFVSYDGLRVAAIEPMPPHLREILDAGGLVPFVKAGLKKR